MRKLRFFAAFALILLSHAGQAQDADDSPASASMDGVWIEAIERYPSIRKNEFSIGLGLYPLDPYYNAISFTGAYNHAFNRSFLWEVVSFNYLFTVDKSLRQELAEQNVQPSEIARPNFILSTNLMFMNAFGKFSYSDDRVRFFRAGPVIGAGLFRDSTGSYPTANVGLRLDLHVSETFSWKLDLRNHVAVTNGFALYPVVGVSGGLSF